MVEQVPPYKRRNQTLTRTRRVDLDPPTTGNNQPVLKLPVTTSMVRIDGVFACDSGTAINHNDSLISILINKALKDRQYNNFNIQQQ